MFSFMYFFLLFQFCFCFHSIYISIFFFVCFLIQLVNGLLKATKSCSAYDLKKAYTENKTNLFLFDTQPKTKRTKWTLSGRLQSECFFNLDSNEIANLNSQKPYQTDINGAVLLSYFRRCVLFHGQKQFIFSKWNMRQVINKMNCTCSFKWIFKQRMEINNVWIYRATIYTYIT